MSAEKGLRREARKLGRSKKFDRINRIDRMKNGLKLETG
jgi:hypothetical protein